LLAQERLDVYRRFLHDTIEETCRD
jgi:hypothetical protein